MAFRLGYPGARGGFGGPTPTQGFGNFRMQFRPQNGSNQTSTQDLKPTNESGLLFISNIHEKCPNDLVKDMLDTFGKVEKWTRICGPDGNYPPFGFCGYQELSSAVMAILTLNNFCIGNKRLNAKADEKAKKGLVDFVVNDRIARNLPRKTLGKELEPDEGDRDQIKNVRDKLRDILRTRVPELIYEKDDDLEDNKEEKPPVESDKSKKHRSKKRSRSRHSPYSRSHSKSRSSKRRRKSVSSSSTSSSHSYSDHETRKKRSSPDDPINGLDSDDSDVIKDRKERKREQRKKDEDYLKMLKKFEERERRAVKQYMNEDDEDRLRKKLLQKEAKKLAQFLEEYNDERDDQKYYKGSHFSRRRKDYDEERMRDKKDRDEEAKEIEAITAMILKEKAMRNGGTDSSPRTSQKTKATTQSFQYSFVEEKLAESAPNIDSNEWTPVYDKPSTSRSTETRKSKSSAKVITTLQNKTLPQVNSVFAEEDPEEDHTHVIKKKIKPFEITAQDRIESLTAEERKKMIKELIEAIPTTKEEVFDYQVVWDHLDAEMVDQRIKPWVEKKIREYIGEDEASLVDFICERVSSHSEPSRLLRDLAMILDSEAENFTLKLWRLLIFQTEAKKIGLNVNNAKS